jgi:hypothetical protein
MTLSISANITVKTGKFTPAGLRTGERGRRSGTVDRFPAVTSSRFQHPTKQALLHGILR